ncbi:MAG: T9SS type A sorting domain-containing protein, partial [Flavobacteriia bacterium]
PGSCNGRDIAEVCPELNGESLSVQLFPNPVSDNLTVNILQYEPGEVTCEIYSQYGNLIQEMNLGSVGNNHSVTYNLSDYVAGLYHIQIETTDNGIPAQTVTKNIPIRVVYDANLAGTNEMDIARIGVYPNPTSETIQISGLQANELLELFDGSGRLIQALRVTKSSEQLSLPQVGFYILKCSSENRPLTVFKLQRI